MSWPMTEFQDLHEIPSKNGLTRPARVRGSGYKMINMGELFAHDRIGNIEMELVPMNDKELSSMLVERGDLLFARQSLVLAGAGKCSIVREVEEPTTFESHIIRVRLKKNMANPDFYHYYFKSPSCGIKSIVTQGVQAGIRGNDLKLLPVHVPPLAEQQRIADVLSTYDDLIENNRRRMALLEEAARQLYREWFVRLRFPGHEHTRIIDGVPKGWEVVTLEQICVAPNGVQTGPFGSQLHQSDYSETGVPVVMPKDMAQLRVDTDKIARIPEEIAQRLARHRLQPGDTVYGRRGDIGRRAFIDKRQAGFICGTGSLRIRPNPAEINPRYLFDTLGTQKTAGIIANRAKGATMLNLNQKALESVPLLLAPRRLQDLYAAQVQDIMEQCETLIEMSRRLRDARDLLLPRLMSGEIAV